MNDPLRLYELVYRAVGRARADLAEAWKVGLLIAVAIAVGWRVVFAWLGGAISGAEAFVLCLGIVLGEFAAANWLSEFEGMQLGLLLALPLAVWAGVEILVRVTARESRRSFLAADMRRYRAAVGRDPRNVAAHELLGDAYLKAGQLGRGLDEYRAALALSPGSYAIRYKFERARRLQGAAQR
jgi:tetratricopeptide (TPR) repeat protein